MYVAYATNDTLNSINWPLPPGGIRRWPSKPQRRQRNNVFFSLQKQGWNPEDRHNDQVKASFDNYQITRHRLYHSNSHFWWVADQFMLSWQLPFTETWFQNRAERLYFEVKEIKKPRRYPGLPISQRPIFFFWGLWQNRVNLQVWSPRTYLVCFTRSSFALPLLKWWPT